MENKAMVTTHSQPGSVYYPEEDEAVTESIKHAIQYANLLNTLRLFFKDRHDVLVGGNNFVYYQEGDPTKCFSPDIFVALGVPDRPLAERGSFRVWEEGAPPTVIIELTSSSTRRVDTVQKLRQYAKLGVAEYYLFDPLNEFLKPPLQGHHLDASGHYQRLPGEELDSPALGLRLVVRDGWLRLLDPAAGALLPTLEEAEAARVAAEAEIARLRAELARLRGEM
jgi:Uma2 family endonuclease